MNYLARLQSSPRNALSAAAPGGVPQAEATAPNALMSRPRDPHPYDTIFDAARKAGVDINKSSPEDVLDAAWSVDSSDMMGEAIDNAARQFGVTPPWQRRR